MAPPVNLGEFEQLILLAVLRLRDDAYGVTIRAELADRAGRSVAPGALYTALERLETKACVRSRMGDPTPERGGRARRYFSVTPLGLRALRQTHAGLTKLARGLEAVLEDA